MSIPVAKTMEMVFVKEVKDNKEILETRRFKNVKVDALDTDVQAVADAISLLSATPMKVLYVSVQSRVEGGTN